MANEIFLDNNEKFHVFSKSPITPSMGLAQAVNKSGHTTTTSDVWSQDIPWFFSVDDQATALTTGKDAKLNDLVLIGSNVFKRNATAYSDEAAFTDLWESLTLEDGTKLYNSDNEHVLTYHKGVSVTFLTTSNNAKQASNYAGRVFKSDGSVIEQFVASTDKVSSGVPSTGYGVAVYKSGSPLSEGEAESNFIANSYAGIIQFNTKVGPSTAYTADVFEYVGDKLNTSITELAKKVESVTATAGEGVQAVTDAATTAGLSVSTKTITVEGQTDPVTVKALNIDVAEVSADGNVTVGDENKLVTATGAQNIANKAASDEITSATLAAGQKIADTSETSKLVTAEQVKTYVSENAKVTLTQGTGITVTPNGESSTAFTVAVDNTVATAQSVTDLAGRVSETEEAIDSLTTGDNSVSSQIANATLSATSTGGDKVTVTLGGTVEAPTLSVVESDIASAQTLNAVKNTADSAVQTVTGDTYITATKTDTGVTLSTQISAIDAALADENSEVGAAIKAAASASTTLGSTTISSNDTDTGIKVELGGTVAAPTVDVTVTTATLGTDNKSFTTETSSNFAKASDVVTVATTIAAEKVASIETTETTEIEADSESTSTKLATEASVAKTAYSLTAAIDAIAGVGVSYEVLGDNEKHESVTTPAKGRIYLEKDVDAADGTYIEWFYTGTAWEKIGSTKADHSVYAKTITINGVTNTVSNNAVDLGKAVTSVTAGNGITSGTVSESGALSLTLDEASTTQKGIVELASTHEATDTAKAATGATVAAAISDIASTSQSDNGVTVTTAGGSVTGVEVTTTSIVSEGALVESVTDDNLITAADALAAVKLAKPENYVKSVTVGSITTSGETALTINDGRTTVYPNDLWGTTVSMVGNTITVQGGPIDGSIWGPKNGYNTVDFTDVLENGYERYYPQGSKTITKVENNMVYNGTAEVANFKTNELVNGRNMFRTTSLTSFNGDLSSLVNGYEMFYNCTSLTSFSGDLSSLDNGYSMFTRTSLASFSGDLSSLINGSYMFSRTSLESFSGDLSSLINGSGMFKDTSLESFRGDLSSLVNGYAMFNNTALTSFSGDLSSLVNGDNMFNGTSLTSFNGDLSSLVNGHGMFYYTPITSFNSDLSSLVNGDSMFYYTPITSFNSDLSSLVDGGHMFYHCTSLESFSGDLSSLVDGGYMFSYCTSLESFSGDLSGLVDGRGMFENTSLDVESVELICDVLPNYNTENGGKNLQTATWNSSGDNKGKYTYSDWTSGSYNYPIINFTTNSNSMSKGNADGINRNFGTSYISGSNVKSITIKWSDISVLSENDRTAITKLFTDTATEKGWTFITNTELGGTVSPNAIMATDGTIQYYVLAKKDEATEDDATHIDASGKLWKFDTAEAIIGPNIKYWSMFATVEDALTEWELTPWTKPTEEETED